MERLQPVLELSAVSCSQPRGHTQAIAVSKTTCSLGVSTPAGKPCTLIQAAGRLPAALQGVRSTVACWQPALVLQPGLDKSCASQAGQHFPSSWEAHLWHCWACIPLWRAGSLPWCCSLSWGGHCASHDPHSPRHLQGGICTLKQPGVLSNLCVVRRCATCSLSWCCSLSWGCHCASHAFDSPRYLQGGMCTLKQPGAWCVEQLVRCEMLCDMLPALVLQQMPLHLPWSQQPT